MKITQQLVNEYFSYNDGVLSWKKKSSNRAKVGFVVKRVDTKGYATVGFMKKVQRVHRLIFLMHHGWLPEEVDHIDLDRTNNRIENLRASDGRTNQYNVAIRKDNTSGVKNVSWDKERKKWGVKFQINNKPKTIGRYADFELAELVAIEYRNKHHKEFANHVGGYNPVVTYPFKEV